MASVVKRCQKKRIDFFVVFWRVISRQITTCGANHRLTLSYAAKSI
jgi:hypothetical protein